MPLHHVLLVCPHCLKLVLEVLLAYRMYLYRPSTLRHMLSIWKCVVHIYSLWIMFTGKLLLCVATYF